MKESDAERMAMRDGFAMAALIGAMAASRSTEWGTVKTADAHGWASLAYSFAEAMMEVRAARPLP